VLAGAEVGVVSPPAGAVVSAGGVVSLGPVVSVGGLVDAGAIVVAGGTVAGGGDDPESLFGRRTQISTAVTTTTASEAMTAVATSRRSRGGRYPSRRLAALIVSAPFR
jgi:hypothetical protein